MADEERFYYFVGIFPDIFSVRMVFFQKPFRVSQKKRSQKNPKHISPFAGMMPGKIFQIVNSKKKVHCKERIISRLQRRR